ncbi:MAG: DUF3868 domain-containing protein [Bacteroidales bacterium]|nr:DUF3868 domain-containing protein [Bacteroidales bacterium]
MNKSIVLLMMSLCSLLPLIVKGEEQGTLKRNGAYMEVSIPIDLKQLKVGSTDNVVITPKLQNGSDSLLLPDVSIHGRRSYIYYLRNEQTAATPGQTNRVFEKKNVPADYRYEQIVPYAEWMDGAELTVEYNTYGCCDHLAQKDVPVARYEEFHPAYIYTQPTTAQGIKTRSISGSAFIDFPVDQTIIYPEYRNNTVELGKISATIDSVRGDADITIDEVWLKGFASPESPYKHNTDLAKGRVAALKEHVQRLYKFEPGVIRTAYEPEDWEGLRKFVDQSNIENREGILALIDNDELDPDTKEAKIKAAYPKQYKWMLDNWYPALRHTDYRIEYTIRTYYDPQEIAQVLATRPSNVSLNEIYVLANSLDPGSEEFNEVFDTAARLYPDSDLANLNAGVNAMQQGDLERAEAYLSKAGDTPQANYARGVLATMREDYPTAKQYLQLAADAGLQEAKDALEYINQNVNQQQ